MQVSLAAGRAGAAAARREEREMAARQKRLAKEKGRKRAALAEAERGALQTCPDLVRFLKFSFSDRGIQFVSSSILISEERLTALEQKLSENNKCTMVMQDLSIARCHNVASCCLSAPDMSMLQPS
jgi:hypothetical protein